MLDVLADTYRIATRTEAWVAAAGVPARRPLTYRAAPRTGWLRQGLRRIGARLVAWRDRARARAEVRRMSERQLMDIGVDRQDLLRAIDEAG